MMDAWLTRRGSKGLDGLMRAIKDISPSRASPTLPEVLRYADLAAAFVAVESTLKPSHLHTDQALLLHKKFPCLSGGNIMVTARSTSGYIRTALRWFRDLATDPEKRTTTLRGAIQCDIAAIMAVCDQVDLGEFVPTPSARSTEGQVRNASHT